MLGLEDILLLLLEPFDDPFCGLIGGPNASSVVCGHDIVQAVKAELLDLPPVYVPLVKLEA